MNLSFDIFKNIVLVGRRRRGRQTQMGTPSAACTNHRAFTLASLECMFGAQTLHTLYGTSATKLKWEFRRRKSTPGMYTGFR